MDARLYEAAFKGNVPSLMKLLRGDPLLLDKCLTGSCTETPLHIAALLGHVDFVDKILSQKPELAAEFDSQGSCPLHLAAAKGHLSVVKKLLVADPEMCFAENKFGRNPVHVSAIKGKVDVLKEMVHVRPQAALRKVSDGDTILHLCVRNNRLDSLKVLLAIFNNTELINSKNGDGDTILHLTAADHQTEAIKFIINNTTIDGSSRNEKGLTALDISARANTIGNSNSLNVYKSSLNKEFAAATENVQLIENQQAPKKDKKWLEEMRNALLVVTGITAAMAFQAGVNPPGGSWQDDKSSHMAGSSIMADKHSEDYYYFMGFNTTNLVGSLSVILLLISGLPLNNKYVTWVMLITMWIVITSTVCTYMYSVDAITTDITRFNRNKNKRLYDTMAKAVIGWAGLVVLIHGFHFILLLKNSVKKVLECMRTRTTGSNQVDV